MDLTPQIDASSASTPYWHYIGISPCALLSVVWSLGQLQATFVERKVGMCESRKGNEHNNDHVPPTYCCDLLQLSFIFPSVSYTLLHCPSSRSQCLPYHSFEGGALRFCRRSFVFLWRNLWLPLPWFPIHHQRSIPKRVFKRPIPALGRSTIDRARHSLRRPLK
jgi:hypothetical protein